MNIPTYTPKLLCLAVVVGFTSGCSKLKETTGTVAKTNFTKIDSLRSTYLALNDSIVMAWNIMINDDNEKIDNLKRLLEELVYAGGMDTARIADLKLQLGKLKGARYDEYTMTNSDLIDEYDFATNNLVNEVVTFAKSHTSFDRYPLMGQLIREIRNAESRILHHRIYYDLFAKDYNKFLEDHKESLTEIESDVEHQRKPLFELPLESSRR